LTISDPTAPIPVSNPPTTVPPTAVPPTAVPPTVVPPTTVPPTTVSCASTTVLPQTLAMSGANSNYTSASFVSDPNKTYRITVSGVITYWSGGYIADAKYQSYDNWAHTHSDPLPYIQFEDG